MTSKGGRVFLTALLVAGAIRGALTIRRYARYGVVGDSMAPTLLPGDFLVVDLRVASTHPGDIVLAVDPREPGRVIVKRVASLDGDTVTLRGDNPAASTDSRHFGPVPASQVTGRVVLCYWPWPRRRVFRR